MGYRSDVVIGITKEQIFKDNLLTKNLPKLLKKCARNRSKENNAFYWLIEDIKWYDSYPDIEEVNSYLMQLEDEDYGFIRIGEDTDDYEHRGCPWDFDIYLNRHIEFPEEEYFKE